MGCQESEARSAVLSNRWSTVEDYVLRFGVDGLVDDGRSALSIAAEQGTVFIVQKLLEARANPDTCDKHGMSPLMFAARAGHTPVMRVLLSSRASADASDVFGNAPIHGAVGFGHVDAARLLLQSHCDPEQRVDDIRAPEDYGAQTLHETPLHIACQSLHEEQSQTLVRLLLSFGASPAVQDDHGDTPVHHLVRRREVRTLWVLLSGSPFYSKAAVGVQNDHGVTAMDEADTATRGVLLFAPIAAELYYRRDFLSPRRWDVHDEDVSGSATVGTSRSPGVGGSSSESRR